MINKVWAMIEEWNKVVERERNLSVCRQERSFGISVVEKTCVTYDDMRKRSSGFDYGFSVIKFGMRELGIWPVETTDLLLFDVRWTFVTTINLIIAMNLLMEICMGCGDTTNTLECILILNSSIHALCNCLIPKIYRKKLAENVKAAIEDWSSPLETKDEESLTIMMRYARASRIIGMGQLILGLGGCCIYFYSILFTKTYQTDVTSNGTVNRKYIIPVKCFFATVSYTEYKVIMLVQIFSTLTLLITQWAVDTFFFAIVLHLCGQLDVLKTRFSNIIDEKSSTKDHRWTEFRAFVVRHCHLINLADNLEQAFHLSIMIQIIMNAILIALIGYRFILAVKSHNNVEVLSTLIFLNFTIMQSALYTLAGDILEGQSGDIFHTVWQTSWINLPSHMIKSFAFVMMRTKKPLRISAGKFMYISRITSMDIMKAAVSYISFLQITV